MKKNNDEIRSVGIYQPGLSEEEIQKKYSVKKIYKMGSNENPLPPPEGLKKKLSQGLKFVNRYPSYMQDVVQVCARYFKVQTEQVLLGAGSSELIDALIQAYCEEGSAILTSKNTFPLYVICAGAHRVQALEANMEKDFKISLRNLLTLLEINSNVRLIFISNPNNPTGSYLNQKELTSFLQALAGKNVLLILDEAYWAYTRARDFPNSLDLLKKYPHLVVLRSMSKVVGLAGLRAGLMLADSEVVSFVKKVLLPFNMNLLACRALKYCFSSPEFEKYLLDSQELTWQSLDYFYAEFKKMGWKFLSSQGNFLMFAERDVNTFQALLEKGLILRPLGVKGGDLKGFLRMSVGLEHENKAALELIRKV